MTNQIRPLNSIPNEISHYMTQRTYVQGSHIIRSNEHNDYLFFLTKGKVEVVQLTHDGNEIFINELNANDVFGELEVFDEAFKTNTVIAKTDCVVVKLQREHVFEWMKIDRDFSKYLFEVIVNCYIKKCVRTDNLAALTIKQRLLISLFKHYKNGDLALLQKSKLIQEVGAPKRSFNRVLKECCDEGYFLYSNKQFSIANIEKITRFASDFG
ncbi:Crp/Fnr family transcriptional regulator [Psychromonas ossibalaenae]|uniref:Crp/Fnr family transcriptional regulator n=1 Tax=Psychromonas ossibalaenae TaxID=444922 RepID=UPI00146CF639|nr:cyclic nucleotide-binding domain-containing protein [Psychromonas ossibalaenae]